MGARSGEGDAQRAEVGEGAAFGGREGAVDAEFFGTGRDVAVEKGGVAGKVAGFLFGGAAAGASRGEGAGDDANSQFYTMNPKIADSAKTFPLLLSGPL